MYIKGLRERRKAKGLTQAQLAKMLKISPPKLSEIESGTARLDSVRLEILAKILGVSTESLRGY